MATNNLNQAQGETNFEVISRMYAATIAANENKAIIDALLPEA